MDSNLIIAYLDPGTGSIIIQGIIGVVAGVGLFGRRLFFGFISKIGGIFKGRKD